MNDPTLRATLARGMFDEEKKKEKTNEGKSCNRGLITRTTLARKNSPLDGY